MTIAIEIAASLNIHIYTYFGIPVSTSHSIIGGIWGVGIVRGVKSIDLKMARDIVITWAITPLIAGIITYTILKILNLFI